ncbi:MAG: tRNA-binding protein [Spirochaeta sp.]|nr:tRNA-binding protein [Spirochaeta sp.]
MISYEDFTKIELRVGRVIRAEEFPEARKPAYKLWIDFGEYGVKKSSAQITGLYSIEDLVNRMVVAVVNFPVKRIAGFSSEVLVLGAVGDREEVVILGVDRDVEPGTRVL